MERSTKLSGHPDKPHTILCAHTHTHQRWCQPTSRSGPGVVRVVIATDSHGASGQMLSNLLRIDSYNLSKLHYSTSNTLQLDI